MPAATIFCNRCGLPSAGDAQFCQRCGATLAARPAMPVAPASLSSVPHYAGFWIRMFAATLDTLVLLAALYPVRMLLGSAITVAGMDAHVPAHEMLQLRRLV